MTGPFRNGDIVGVDHKGRQYLALVTAQTTSELMVRPLMKNITWFTVRKRDVVAHWRHGRGKHPAVKSSGGVTFG